MAEFNSTAQEINSRIVYYGPGMSGKTTNLEWLHLSMPAVSKGKIIATTTRTDRTLMFDFVPQEIAPIAGHRTRTFIYTVQGQVYYNATRKLVLKDVDAIVFVADSSPARVNDNVQSLHNLEDNLNEYGLSLDEIPWVIQYNKRDVDAALSIEELHKHLNLLHVPAFEAVANTGQGVQETFAGIAEKLEAVLQKAATNGLVPAKTEDVQAGNTATVNDNDSDAVLDDAVDSALREVDAADTIPDVPPAISADNQTEAASPSVNLQAENAPRQAQLVTATRVKTDAEQVVAAPDESATAKPAATHAGDDSRFFSDEALNQDVGRVLELDANIEAPAVDADDENGFITDPMRGATGSEPEAAATTTAMSTNELPVLPVVDLSEDSLEPASTIATPEEPRNTQSPESDLSSPAEVVVPVRLTRAQVNSKAPVRLVLEISIADE